VSLNGRRGNRTVLLFWNPTCGYCQQMLPDVMQWERERASDALALLVISSGPIEANKSQGFRSRVVLDNQFVAGETFGVSGTPSAMLLDEQGKVASGVAVGKEAVLALLSRKFT
jgi:thiol-disulfide isomerase/thioredoxin